MGELDDGPFLPACKQKFSKDEAEIKAAEYCSHWQHELKKPEWHPFKIVLTDGKHQVWITNYFFFDCPNHNLIFSAEDMDTTGTDI